MWFSTKVLCGILKGKRNCGSTRPAGWLHCGPEVTNRLRLDGLAFHFRAEALLKRFPQCVASGVVMRKIQKAVVAGIRLIAPVPQVRNEEMLHPPQEVIDPLFIVIAQVNIGAVEKCLSHPDLIVGVQATLLLFLNINEASVQGGEFVERCENETDSIRARIQAAAVIKPKLQALQVDLAGGEELAGRRRFRRAERSGGAQFEPTSSLGFSR